MTQKIKIFFRLIHTIRGINQFNNVGSSYHRQAKKLIHELTAPFELEQNSLFPANAFLKMQWYMAEFLYTCEHLNRLTGQASTASQRRSYLLSGALGVLCDLLIDDIDMDLEDVKALKNPSKSFKSKNEIESIYLVCYHTFMDALEEEVKEETIYYYRKVFDAQIRSKQQFDPRLDKEEVDLICREKGAFSLLFLRAMIQGKMDSAEQAAWIEIGALIQFLNDAQDLYKDLQKDMRTFATIRVDIANIVQALDLQKQTAFRLFKALPYTQAKKDDFLFTMHLMCVAIYAKMLAINKLCPYQFSLPALKAIPKAQLRSQLKPRKLISYAFPKIMSYQYDTVEYPIKLTNIPSRS